MDPTAILVNSLTEALRQIHDSVAIGLTSAVAVFVLDRQQKRAAAQGSAADQLTVPVFGVPVGRDGATWLLLGVYFVAGLMAAYAAESAAAIVARLSTTPALLSAACTYPGVATAPIGVRLIAALSPAAFATIVLWRMYRRLRSHNLVQTGDVAPLLFGLVPYAALALTLAKLHCTP